MVEDYYSTQVLLTEMSEPKLEQNCNRIKTEKKNGIFGDFG